MNKHTSADEENVGIELITPEKAEEYLGANTHNRNIRSRVVATYASDMKRGDWKWNGEAIKFSESGVLLDGQHRLLAIIESGVSVRMMVVRGLPEETQHTMDTGARRKFSDVLKLRGEVSVVALSAATRSVFLWEQGVRRLGGSGGTQAVSNAQLLRTLERHPWLRDDITALARISANVKLPVSITGALWFAFTNIDYEDTVHFFERLTSAEDQHKGDPIFALRRALLSSAENTKGTRNPVFLTAITIKAWNAYRDGRDVGVLRYVPGGAQRETFPEPK